MSDNFSELIEQLNSDYDLEALAHLQEQHEGDCAKAGRVKVKKAVALAKTKGGFSNTTVAKYLKEEVLRELIECAGDDFARIMCSEKGHRIPEHQQMFQHFIRSYAAMYEHRNGVDPQDKGVDVTQLINLNQWVFIGLNSMLDAAAIPASNDYQIKRKRWEIRADDLEEVKPHRPSVASIHRNIGTMICFQARLKLVKSLWWKWFDKQLQDANKKGSAGLRYFQRDMNEAIAGLISHLQLKAMSSQETYDKLKLITSFDELTRGYGSDVFRITLGSWVYGLIFDNLVVDGVPLFSETAATPTKSRFLEMIKDEHGAPVLSEAWIRTLGRADVKAPMLCPPKRLNPELRGGRIASETLPTMKTWKGHTDMSPKRVDFFNRQALVPLRIGGWNFDLVDSYKKAEQPLGSFDYYIREDNIPLPSDLLEGKPHDYDRWEPNAQHKWNTSHAEWRNVKRQASKIKEAHFHRLRDAGPSYALYDLAKPLVERPAIWIPVRPEFRTRLITDVLYLSYQGRDVAKSLLRLAQPVDIGDGKSTRKWIANQLATTYGSNLDKISISKRINKIEDKKFQEKIRVVATMLDDNGDWSAGNEILQGVDDGDGKPWQFASACREWYELFMQPNPKPTTDLIVNNDCSCSGQQFAAGWRRAKGIAIATNAAPNDDPHDLYKDVWDELLERATSSGEGFSRRHTVELKNGKGRGIMKGGIQPSMYGSGEDTALDGVAAKLEKYHKKGLRLNDAEKALILKLYQPSLDEVCEMNTTNEWFRKLSSALSKKKADRVVIPTPLGDSIVIRYEQSDSYVVDTFRYGSCQYKRSRRTAQLVKPNGKPDRRKWKTSLAANTTHGAGDASMLALALHDAPFHFVTCHDSVGCAAPHMDELRDRMRKAYVEVVSFPIFERILEANGITASQDWPDPMTNDWNPEDALDSEYFLS